MDAYLLIKMLHIVSATVLFGTGLGITFFFLMGMRSGEPAVALFAARTTAIADMIFTLTAGLLQPRKPAAQRSAMPRPHWAGRISLGTEQSRHHDYSPMMRWLPQGRLARTSLQ
jgi:hypothetical protein